MISERGEMAYLHFALLLTLGLVTITHARSPLLYPDDADNITPTTTNSSSTPCAGTSKRVSGRTVTRSLEQVPVGRVCIGSLASPTPDGNFLVFDKKEGGVVAFLGTQSVQNGFRDFTPYVTWQYTPA